MSEQQQQPPGAKVEQAGASAPASSSLFPETFGMTPAIIAAYEAFYRDLPELAKTHTGLWVAYAGPRRLGFGKTKTELIQRYRAQGLGLDDFLVTLVQAVNPDVGPEADVEVT
jgi:hypothetical protein